MRYVPCFPCGHNITVVLSLLNKTPLSDEYTVLFLPTVMLVKPVQYSNAVLTIEVTLSGMTYVPCFPCGYLITVDLSLLSKTPLSDEYTVLFSPTFMLV